MRCFFEGFQSSRWGHTPDDETLVKVVRAAMKDAGFEDVSYFDGGMERAIFDWMESPAGQEWLRKKAESEAAQAA